MTPPRTRLAILLWAADPADPARCAAPFIHALAAAALDCEVEVHFAGPAVRLLAQGVAARTHTAAGKSIYAFMQDAAAAGVRFYACSMAHAEYLGRDTPCIPELAGQAGATAFVGRSLDPDWATLVF